MKHLIAFIFFMVTGAVLFAQDVDTTEVVEEEGYGIAESYSESESDNSAFTKVNPRDTKAAEAYMGEEQSLKKFDEKEWKAIVGDVTFEEKPLEPKPEQKPRSRRFSLPIDPGFLRVISFALIFVVLAAIIYFVVRNTTLTQKIKKIKPTDITAPVDNIEELDIDSLLKKSLADGDLRAAVRVHYLMLLKKLNEVGLIAWKKDKTNSDYLSELYGRNNCYDDVRKLTLAYEIVWYGERSVSPDSFQRIAGEFESVNRQVAKDTTQG